MAPLTTTHSTLYDALVDLSRRHAQAPRRQVRPVPVYCGICGGQIDMGLRAPHPGSHSIDHKVPRAWGGTDQPSNLQPAHLGCNKSKGVRPTLAEFLSG